MQAEEGEGVLPGCLQQAFDEGLLSTLLCHCEWEGGVGKREGEGIVEGIGERGRGGSWGWGWGAMTGGNWLPYYAGGEL